MSKRNQRGEKTSAPSIEEPPESGPSRQLKFSRPAAEEADKVQLDTCQLFLDSLEPVALLLKQGTREVVACNKTAKELGITLGSICYQSWANRETPCPWCQAPKVWKTGKTVRCQVEAEGKIWDAHWVSISDDLYLYYARDITEEKKVEEVLLASKTKLQGYIDNAPDGVLIANSQGKFLEANPAISEMTGYTEKELLQMSIPQILAAESQEDGRRHFAKVVAEGFAHGEFIGLCKDGSKVNYIVDAVRVAEDRFMGFIKDITKRKLAEQSLQEAEAELKHYIDVVPGIIAKANAQTGCFTHCNPAMTSILGFSSEEFLARPFMEFIHQDDRQSTIDEVEKQLKGSPVARFENRYICKDGSYKWLEWRATAVDERGLVYTAATDITDRKRAEEELMVRAHDLGERVKELNGLYGLSQLTSNPDLSPEQVYQQASELLPPAWHYPEVTCGRIVVNQKEFRTDNYVDTAWKLTAEIIVSGAAVGMIEVGYLKETPEMYEGPFLREERDLIDAMAQILGQYIERHQTESRLRDSHTRLIKGQLALETKNTALTEIIEHVSREKKDTGFQIQSNIDRLVVPMISRIEANASEAQQAYLSMLRSSLSEITSPFVTRLEKNLINLTTREVEICNLIKAGLSSKDIANSLQTSEATVVTQRKTIRKKLGLTREKINLANYLQQA